MEYCARCLYPANAKPTIIFDDEGVCSGCRYHESRMKLEVDWEENRARARQQLRLHHSRQRRQGQSLSSMADEEKVRDEPVARHL
jgi:hypothetical protein